MLLPRSPVEEQGGHGGASLAVLLEPVRLQDAARLQWRAVRRLALICHHALAIRQTRGPQRDTY